MEQFTLVMGFSLITGIMGFLVGVSAGRQNMEEPKKIVYICPACRMEIVFFEDYNIAHLGNAHHGFTPIQKHLHIE